MSTALNGSESILVYWLQPYISLGLKILLKPITLVILTVVTTFETGYNEAIAKTPNAKQAPAQSQISGTWELTPTSPNVANVRAMPTLKVVITPEGKIFFQNPTAQGEYIEVGVIKKTSDTTSLPPNVKITDPYASPNRAVQSEAKTAVSTMNRSQQAHYLEKNAWGKSLNELEIEMKPETENYRYSIKIDKTITTVKTNPYPGFVINTAIAKKSNLRSYVGLVYLGAFPSSTELVTFSVWCGSDEPTIEVPPLPKWNGKELTCPDGYTSLNY